MELRSKARRQQQEKFKKQSATEANAELDILPGEIMSMLAARYLSQEDVAAASMTCQCWARVLRAGEQVEGVSAFGGQADTALRIHNDALCAIL
jgi:hypothetical protein